MLYIAYALKDVSFSRLMRVYEEGNRENAGDFWPDLEENQALIRAEQEFYQYLKQVFFTTENARYCIWTEKGRYISALRLEPYRDGLLLEALETEPGERRKGYAVQLIRSVQEQLSGEKIYSHVSKRNLASLRTHERCGFRIIADNAVYADGSVTNRSYTLCWEGRI